jgi:hypothetical protein
MADPLGSTRQQPEIRLCQPPPRRFVRFFKLRFQFAATRPLAFSLLPPLLPTEMDNGETLDTDWCSICHAEDAKSIKSLTWDERKSMPNPSPAKLPIRASLTGTDSIGLKSPECTNDGSQRSVRPGLLSCPTHTPPGSSQVPSRPSPAATGKKLSSARPDEDHFHLINNWPETTSLNNRRL